MKKDIKKKISPYVSLGTALVFLVLAVSGTALFMAPSCRVARLIGWEYLFFCKESWGSVHITFSFIFVILGVAHLLLNFRAFLQYLRNRADILLGISTSLVVTAAAVISVFFLSAFDVPPVSWIYRSHEKMKESWSAVLINKGISIHENQALRKGNRRQRSKDHY